MSLKKSGIEEDWILCKMDGLQCSINCPQFKRGANTDAKSLLRRHTTQARQILRRLLEKPLICEVIEEGGKKGYRVTGQGSYLHLIPESLASPFVVSPTGFEPVLLP